MEQLHDQLALSSLDLFSKSLASTTTRLLEGFNLAGDVDGDLSGVGIRHRGWVAKLHRCRRR
jgi:hypothetical protein